MAVKLMTAIHKWNVLSSDDWPVTAVAEGSEIHVVDTGEEYIYTNGMWEQDLRRIYALTIV